MKSKEEIEQLADEYSEIGKGSGLTFKEHTLENIAFINGYTQCQNDMADKKYSEQDIQNVLDGFTNEAPGQYIKTNFIELLNKQD